MATNRMVLPQQEGADTSIKALDYFDIMVIGKTGQGKSTTADKLLIANPQEKDYTEIKFVSDDQNLQDLQMWWLPNDPDAQERITTRLRNLVFYRASKAPHISVNEAHTYYPDEGRSGMAVNRRTLKCELFSNETTKVRILDVPGFFSEIPPKALQTSAAAIANQADLGTMRRIIRIQTIMQMGFKRILYFLPSRDTLELNDSAFQQELQLMYTHFGRWFLLQLWDQPPTKLYPTAVKLKCLQKNWIDQGAYFKKLSELFSQRTPQALRSSSSLSGRLVSRFCKRCKKLGYLVVVFSWSLTVQYVLDVP